MDGQDKLMLCHFRKGLTAPTEARRVFNANALRAHSGCTIKDLKKIMECVPTVRCEAARQVFSRLDDRPDEIVRIALKYPDELLQIAWEVLLQRHGQTGRYLKQLEEVAQQADIKLCNVSTHHYWWPRYAWKGSKRNITMQIAHALHGKYHRYFLKTCRRAAIRRCHQQPCRYERLCCYSKNNIPFPEEES